MSVETALDRTVRLCRYVVPDAAPAAIITALTATTVTIVADRANLASGACQSAVVTLAQLVMQLGCSVRLVAPAVTLRVRQPPWRGDTLRAVLQDMAAESVPGAAFASMEASDVSGEVFVFGDAPWPGAEGWRVGATRWVGAIHPLSEKVARWTEDFPIGGLAAAALAAAEAFKRAMRTLGPTGPHLDELAPVHRATVALGDEATPAPSTLGRIDCVSGGAIVQAALHALMRVPALAANVRVIEPERFDLTNVNRYSLGRRSQVGVLKVDILAGCAASPFVVTGDAARFDEETAAALSPLAPCVIVGTDNVPSRWAVQNARPEWLVVGATSEFMAIVSEHDGSGGCAGCAHPDDDGVHVEIPTVSFVSYWGGLMVAARVLRHAAGAVTNESAEIRLLFSLRQDSPDGEIRYTNVRSPRCPLKCSSERRTT
jgi:hypothetical protein